MMSVMTKWSRCDQIKLQRSTCKDSLRGRGIICLEGESWIEGTNEEINGMGCKQQVARVLLDLFQENKIDDSKASTLINQLALVL